MVFNFKFEINALYYSIAAYECSHVYISNGDFVIHTHAPSIFYHTQTTSLMGNVNLTFRLQFVFIFVVYIRLYEYVAAPNIHI